MSAVLPEIDQTLASYAAQYRARSVAVYLGKRRLTQLTLEVALLGASPTLSAAEGRLLAYHSPDLLRDEGNVDGMRAVW